MLNGLDLFTGIGGISVALRDFVRPVAYVERDKFCHRLLLSRMLSGDIPTAPIWDDVRTLCRESLPKELSVDIIYGGFPCQDISYANSSGAGLDGERSGLFFEIVRLANEFKPTFIFLENVANIVNKGLDRVVEEMATIGYDCRWDCISATIIGAPHPRRRWFSLFRRIDAVENAGAQRFDSDVSERRYTASSSSRMGSISGIATSVDRCSSSRDTPILAADNTLASEHCGSGVDSILERASREDPSRLWRSEPALDRMADGLCGSLDRMRGLGNAVVPQQAREAFLRLMGVK
jgi:DNA (cytosine-5)-methyltransferase 1